MKYRPQRGGLKESMEEVVELFPTYSSLAWHLHCEQSQIEVKPYGYDSRIDWHTFIVTVDGQAVGFCNEIVFD